MNKIILCLYKNYPCTHQPGLDPTVVSPAELVIYEGEEHNFSKPKARVASMIRKLDWFNYWLLNIRDPDPAKQEQYLRWDQMRAP